MSINSQLMDHIYWVVTWKEGVGIKMKQNKLTKRYRRMNDNFPT